MNRIGSAINMLGRRIATGMNDVVLESGEDRLEPVQGYLITDGEDNYVDDAGNQFIYAQIADIVTGHLLDSADNTVTDADGNNILVFEKII